MMKGKEYRPWITYMGMSLFLFRILGTWKPLGFKNRIVRIFVQLNIYLCLIINFAMTLQNLISLVLSEADFHNYLETVLFTNFYFTICFLQIFCMFQMERNRRLFDIFEKCYKKGLEICGEVAFRKRWYLSEKTVKKFAIFWVTVWILIGLNFCGYPRFMSIIFHTENNNTFFSPAAHGWYLVSYEEAPVIREIWFCVEFYSVMTLVYIEGVVDIFVISLVVYLITIVENLCDAIRSLPVDAQVDWGYQDKNNHFWKLTIERDTDDERIFDWRSTVNLRKCIKQHQRIIKLHAEINEVTSPLMVAVMVKSFCAIAIALFKATEGDLGNKNLIYLSLVPMYSVQFFWFSWFGDNLTLQTRELIFCCYNSGWIEAKQEFTKMLLIFMTRAQRLMKLPAGPLFFMTIPFLVDIERLCFSVYTLLKRVNN